MNTKKRTRSLCLLLCAALMLTACAKVEYASYELTPNEYLMGEDGREVYSPAGGGAQLTAEDIDEDHFGVIWVAGNLVDGFTARGIYRDVDAAVESNDGKDGFTVALIGPLQ